LTVTAARRIKKAMRADTLRPFHLAVQVRDLDEARAFYGGLLRCREGRSAAAWVDFDLFGHQIVCHVNPDLGPTGRVAEHRNPVDGDDVPIPHFGVVLTMEEWQALAERLQATGADFMLPPHVRFAGLPGEQATLFLRDPSGNALEFKGFRNLGQLFVRQVRSSGPSGPVNLPTLAWLGVLFGVLVWSGVQPKDYLTWLLEVSPVLIGIAVLALTRRSFPLTSLAYVLILAHSIILMVGGHYTYAEVPLGEWAREAFSMTRNNYDKVGHFAQGFVPATLAREVLVRRHVISGRRWLAFLVVCVCLAISGVYELIEWWVALVSKEAADSFLGTQGYQWDTQSDIGWALLGAVLALVLLSRVHDRQLERLAGVDFRAMPYE
jgi:putative membrane protein